MSAPSLPSTPKQSLLPSYLVGSMSISLPSSPSSEHAAKLAHFAFLDAVVFVVKIFHLQYYAFLKTQFVGGGNHAVNAAVGGASDGRQRASAVIGCGAHTRRTDTCRKARIKGRRLQPNTRERGGTRRAHIQRGFALTAHERAVGVLHNRAARQKLLDCVAESALNHVELSGKTQDKIYRTLAIMAETPAHKLPLESTINSFWRLIHLSINCLRCTGAAVCAKTCSRASGTVMQSIFFIAL